MILYSPTTFEPQDVILEQIRNGGTLEYFKDTEIQALTGKLVAEMAKVKNRNERESEFFSRQLGEFNFRHADTDWLLALAQNTKGSLFDTLKIYESSEAYRPFHLVKPEKIDREEIYTTMGLVLAAFTSTRKLTYKQYQKVNANLLKRLREVYRL